MKKDKDLLALERKSKAALVEIAKSLDPSLVLKKTWTGRQIAAKIHERRTIEAKARNKVSALSATGGANGTVGTARISEPVNADFEAAVKSKAEDPGTAKRGGHRPGAGRPQGLTDAKARAKNLPQYPNIAIKQGIEWVFELWASATKIEMLALDEDEAMLLSLPVTQIQEYFFPDLIPEIAGAFVMLIYATTKIAKPRLALIRALHKAKSEGRDISPIVNELNNDAKSGHKADNRQDRQRKNSQSPKPDRRSK